MLRCVIYVFKLKWEASLLVKSVTGGTTCKKILSTAYLGCLVVCINGIDGTQMCIIKTLRENILLFVNDFVSEKIFISA